jgi:hypothetical protein
VKSAKSARKREGRLPQKSARKREGAFKSSYQGGGISKEEGGEGTALVGAAPAADAGKPNGAERCGCYVTNAYGLRLCGRPVLPGTDRCPEHAATHPVDDDPPFEEGDAIR